MRRAAYVGASAAAATAVILRAFHERPNFYSATVYLGQSTACRMILLNMLIVTLAASTYALQRLLYGPLRAIEIEQLWDRAWYAITETALAMTTFRDEVGGYFFLMFMTLLAGKVWGWIGEGRVETLEQQPPANPKLFYFRLTTSLILSEAFDLLMFRFCLSSILDQKPPRAGMMIMFVFEFAILAINSASTLSRYGLALWERWVVKKQTEAKIAERRQEIRAQRAASDQPSREESSNTQVARTQQSSNEPIDIDENEIDVPGWQEKGKWVLFLDLTTDFLKLVFYMSFFMILIIFAGIPIHMFRDLFITTRSFVKRINDYLKYRNATRDMNSRYPDATVEELQRDGTCIICREEMRPWQPTEAAPAGNANEARQNRPPSDERQRPKKLPCGHILHFSCLRSWLERQQVCPTCRRSVLDPDPSRNATTSAQPANGPNANANQAQAPGHQHQHQPPAGGLQANQGQQQPLQNQQGGGGAPGINRIRTFNLGGIRLTLAAGNRVNVRDALNHAQNHGNTGAAQAQPASGNASPQTNGQSGSQGDYSVELDNIQQRLAQDLSSLTLQQRELAIVRALQNEYSRLRSVQANGNGQTAVPPQTSVHIQHHIQTMPAMPGMQAVPGMPMQPSHMPFVPPMQMAMAPRQMPPVIPQGGPPPIQPPRDPPRRLYAGDHNLPEGLTLPDRWSIIPLQQGPTHLYPDQEATTSTANPADSQAHNDDTSQYSNHSAAPASEQDGFNSANATRASSETPQNEAEAATPQAEPAAINGDQADAGVASAPHDTNGVPSSDQGQGTIPQWSSSADAEGSSGANGHVVEDKGKGRAAQVEDAEDDGS